MLRNDRFSDDPPLDAYSRVSNPERFRPLHARALRLLEVLRTTYEVTQVSSFESLPWMSPFEHAQDPVTLTPAHMQGASLAVAFTSYPGLVVRFGRWQADWFPACGCDACGETSDEEGERFEQLVRDVVAGHFREELKIAWLRQPRLHWWLGEGSLRAGERSAGFRVLCRTHAAALRMAGSGVVAWQAWPKRPASSSP